MNKLLLSLLLTFVFNVCATNQTQPQNTLEKLKLLIQKFSIREMESVIRWAHTYAYDRQSKIVDKQDFEQAIKRVQEGRKALDNKESWPKWGKRYAGEVGDAAIKGGASIAIGSALLKGAQSIPEDSKAKLINVASEVAVNITNKFARFFLKRT